MKNTRKVITVLMCVAIALSVFTSVACTIVNRTCLNETFFTDYFITPDLEQACEKQLKLKFEVLEKKSNIPAKVFRRAIDEKSVNQMMKLNIANFFAGRDTTAYSEDMIEYFYKICVEYLEEENIEYDEENIRNTAKNAAKIYSNSVGFSNVEHLKPFVDEKSKELTRATSFALGFVIVACLLLYSMYSDPKQSLKFIANSIIASGVSGISITILSVIMKYGIDLPISPTAYLDATNHLIYASYFFAALIFLSIAIVGIVVSALISRQIDKEESRRRSRFSKRMDTI